MILGKRSAATTHAFAARLVALAEPAEEQEVQKYYVDPQNKSERCGRSALLFLFFFLLFFCMRVCRSADEQEVCSEWIGRLKRVCDWAGCHDWAVMQLPCLRVIWCKSTQQSSVSCDFVYSGFHKLILVLSMSVPAVCMFVVAKPSMRLWPRARQ